MPASDAPAAPPAIEFWFDFSSPYSYLSAMRIEQAAASRRLQVRWRPLLLGPVFRALGWKSSPFVEHPVKGDYMWKDLARECHKAGLPWRRPSVFPRTSLLPLRVALLGAEQPWIGAFTRRIMSIHFEEDRDIDEAGVVREVLQEDLGLPADTLLDAAQSPHHKAALRRQTEEAVQRGIFGAPTFFVGDTMFWGNDRLDDALAEAALHQR